MLVTSGPYRNRQPTDIPRLYRGAPGKSAALSYWPLFFRLFASFLWDEVPDIRPGLARLNFASTLLNIAMPGARSNHPIGCMISTLPPLPHLTRPLMQLVPPTAVPVEP